MAEDKKKNNAKKTTTTKKVNNSKKTTTTKKVNTQNNKKKPVKATQATKQQPKKQVKKVTPKKTEPKKVEPKKVAPKKVAPKKVEEPKIEKVELEITEEIPVVAKEIEKIIEVEVDTTEEESILEKTLIFDGRENQNLAEVVKNLEEENVVLEDKIVKRSKGKKIAVMILTALIFVVIIATTIYVIRSEVERVNNNLTLNSNIYDKVSQHYGSINDIDTEKKTDSNLVNENYKNIEDISLGQFEKKILEKEDMIVLVSSTTCYYCIEYEPIVDEVFKELDKKIYRINIISLNKEEETRFRTYYAYKKAPTIFTIKNGVVKEDIVGKKDKEELTTWLNKNM
jgi:predicted bacteriocin transport accessory protein